MDLSQLNELPQKIRQLQQTYPELMPWFFRQGWDSSVQ